MHKDSLRTIVARQLQYRVTKEKCKEDERNRNTKSQALQVWRWKGSLLKENGQVSCNTKCKIETEVVTANIPLLLSKTSLKRAGTVLDMESDSAVMFNQPVKLDFTSQPV